MSAVFHPDDNNWKEHYDIDLRYIYRCDDCGYEYETYPGCHDAADISICPECNGSCYKVQESCDG